MAGLKVWAESKIKKIKLLDMPLIKISIIAFTLMAAKLLPWLLSLDWYWYTLIFILALIIPMKTVLSK